MTKTTTKKQKQTQPIPPPPTHTHTQKKKNNKKKNKKNTNKPKKQQQTNPPKKTKKTALPVHQKRKRWGPDKDKTNAIYNRNSMARTFLEPWKFVRDMGSSSHWGLVMATGQGANDDNLGESFRSSTR